MLGLAGCSDGALPVGGGPDMTPSFTNNGFRPTLDLAPSIDMTQTCSRNGFCPPPDMAQLADLSAPPDLPIIGCGNGFCPADLK